MKKFSILLILLLMFSQFSINAMSDTATNILYVDDDNTSGPWDGTQDYPFQCIQDGVDAAETGDTIFVYGGFYNEQTLIDKTINLQGESLEDTIIDGTGLGILCTIRDTNNVVVSGFTFQNAEKNAEALYLYYSTSCIIEQNRFTKNKDNSIYVGGGGHTISENEFVDNSYVNNTIWVISTGNTLVNNSIRDNEGSGISLMAGYNVISGNVIEKNAEYGIALFDNPEIRGVVISDNIIKRNKGGIVTSDKVLFNVITNNTISRNRIVGIILGSGHSTISYNTIEKSPIGIFHRGDTIFNNLSHNTFLLNLVGILNFLTVSNSYAENNFIGNMVHTLFLQFIPLHRYPDDIEFDSWDNNYWGNWRFDRPKPIFGLYCSQTSWIMPLPYCLYDQNPASEPFEI